MPRRNIEIPEPHVRELDKIAVNRDVSMPQVVRDLIREYLEKHKDEIPA